MRGIRITSEFQETSPGCAVPIGFPDDTSAFALFFAPILPRIQTIHWLYHSWPFVRGDEEFDREVAKLPPNNGEYNEGFGYIPPDLLLPRFARYVTNDWASFYGFHQKPDAKKFFEQSQADADRRWKFYQFMAARDTKVENEPIPAPKQVAAVDA